MENVKVQYKDYLSREFSSRNRKNPGYSLRAFARDLEMQPSKLSEVLRGLCGLSCTKAIHLAKKLKLSEPETEHFVNLVAIQHERSNVARKNAEKCLKTLGAVHGYDELSLERFRVISDWHHNAILELTEVDGFESDPRWIAGRLGVSTHLASEAIARLLDFGLLKHDKHGNLVQTHFHLATPSGIPSREIREHHSQILAKAETAIEEVPISERDFSSVTLAIDSSRLDWARKEIKEFRRRFSSEIQEGTGRDRVYCISIQFFPIDKNLKPKRGYKK